MGSQLERRLRRALIVTTVLIAAALLVVSLLWRMESDARAVTNDGSQRDPSTEVVAGGPSDPAVSAAAEPEASRDPPRAEPAPSPPKTDNDAPTPPFSVAGLDGECISSHTAWVLLARVQRVREPLGHANGLPLREKPATFLHGGGAFRISRDAAGAVRFEHSTRAPGPFPQADRWVRVVDQQGTTLHEDSSVSAFTGLKARVEEVRDFPEWGVRAYHLARVPVDIMRPIGSSFDILPSLIDPQLFPADGVARLPVSVLRGVFALPDGGDDGPNQRPFGLLEFLTTLGRDQAPLMGIYDGLTGDVQVSLSRSSAEQLHLQLGVAARGKKHRSTFDRSKRGANEALPFLALESGNIDLNLDGRGELVLHQSTSSVASARLTCLLTAKFSCTLRPTAEGATPITVDGELRGVLYVFRCCDDCAAGAGCISSGATFDFYEPGSPPPGW